MSDELAYKTLFMHWTLKKFRATVINDIWPEVLFFTSVATIVAVISSTVHSLAISNQLLTVLGTVLALVISFRTSSAYERYIEGRKLWSNIALVSRNMGTFIWQHISVEKMMAKLKANAPTDKPLSDDDARLAVLIEKKTMINIIQAFSVAMKHYLRGEPGIYYEDLYPLVCFLPRFIGSTPLTTAAPTQDSPDLLPLWHDELGQLQHRTGTGSDSDGSPKPSVHRKTSNFDPESVLAKPEQEGIALRPARNRPAMTVYEMLPFLYIFKPLVDLISRIWTRETLREQEIREKRAGIQRPANRTISGAKKTIPVPHSNVPLEMSLFLSAYLARVMDAGAIQIPIAATFAGQMVALNDSALSLERVRSTPIPFAYQTHLRLTTWLYLLVLPFQLVGLYKSFLAIPATAFVSFLLVGFLEIGAQIENPFQYELNDLDVDGFCLSIERELHHITAHPVLSTATFVFSALNQPFAPTDRRPVPHIIP